MITGCGRTGPDPKDDLVLKDGTVVPLGKGISTGISNSSLLYNEYPFILSFESACYTDLFIWLCIFFISSSSVVGR